MFTVQALLRRYARTTTSIRAGSDELKPPSSETMQAPVLDKERFRKDLDSLRRMNTLAIATLAAVISIAFLITLYLILRQANDAVIAALFVGFGGLSAGITTAILGVFRVKAQSDLLVMLSTNIQAVSLQTIVDVLSKRT